MRNNRFPIFILIFFLTTAWAAALGKKDAEPPRVRVTGQVRLVHDWPSPELVITGTDDEWHIPQGEAHKLKNFQRQVVTLEGTETVISLTFANGRPAGERRILTNIRLIQENPPDSPEQTE